jgi:hypothetical protein
VLRHADRLLEVPRLLVKETVATDVDFADALAMMFNLHKNERLILKHEVRFSKYSMASHAA